MTKKVRIENADTSNHKVLVSVMRPGLEMADGMGGANTGPDVVVSEHALHNPTDMVEVYVHSGQYIVVREV